MTEDTRFDQPKGVDESPDKNSSGSKIVVNKRSGNNLWAIVLIFVGSLLFLNTTNIVSWEVWGYLWRFWPLLIIFSGLQVLFGSSGMGRWILGILALGSFIFIGLISISMVNNEQLLRWNIQIPDNWSSWVAVSEDRLSETLAVRLEDFEGVEALDFDVNLGAGEFNLSDTSDEYLEVTAEFYESYGKPRVDSELTNEVLMLAFSQEHDRTINIGNTRYDMEISPDHRLTLTIDIGAGHGDVDLASVPVESVRTDVGTGNLTLQFSEVSLPQSESTIEVGTGATTVIIPEDVGYKVKYQVGVGSVEIDGKQSGSLGSNGTVTSDDYDNLDKKVTFTVDVGVGQFTLIQE